MSVAVGQLRTAAPRFGMVVLDEAEVIRCAQRGDVDMFNQLVSRYEQDAFNVAYRLIGDREQAADITQEAFLSAYRALGRFREGSFRAWLLRIVANACASARRARRRRPETSLDAMLDDPVHRTTFEDATPGVEERVLRRELLAHVQEGLQTLSYEQRTVILLADVHGLPYDEIARITGTELGTVKSRVCRGRARLRDYLRRSALIPVAQ